MSKRTSRIIGGKELKQYIPYSAVHIWRLEKEGRFPKRISFGPHRVGWDLDEVLAWVEARKSQRER
jgi:prophage regulatory protein